MSGSCSRPLPFHPKAASEDLSYGRMEDELTCPVCLELFADPLMLPCSHSICKKCLADICSSRSKHGKEGLECPSCRKLLTMSAEQISRLPRNLALENIVFRFQEIRSCSMTKSKSLDLSSTSALDTSLASDADLPVFGDEGVDSRDCSLCEGSGTPNRAQFFCQQCAVLYCQSCLDSYHPRRGPLSHHKLRKPSSAMEVSAPSFCRDHDHEMANIFCDACKVLVCYLCVCDGIGKHSGHKILSQEVASKQLREDIGKAKEQLESLMSMVSERNSRLQEMADDVQHVARQAKERVDNQHRSLLQDLTAALQQHCQVTKAGLDLVEGQQRSLYEGHLSRGRSQLGRMEEEAEACRKLLDQDSQRGLLMQALELEPIQEALARLQTQQEGDDLSFKSLPPAPRVQQDIKAVVQNFRQEAIKALTRVTGSEDNQCECLVPTVKSTVTSPGGKSEIPRVQNRCLITWGFNCTTFTAEPLSSNSLWSVTVGKNTNKIGDIKSGYIFGVGISTENHSFKEQVGMNAKSYGVVCHNGTLSFCHDSQMEPLMPLDSLPISLTLAVVVDKPGFLALSYSLTNSSWGDTLIGKRLIMDKAFGSSFFPVFSVSQRVKMQFQSFL